MLSWGGAVSLILSGQPNLPAQTKQFNLDIDTFFEGLIYFLVLKQGQCLTEAKQLTYINTFKIRIQNTA